MSCWITRSLSPDYVPAGEILSLACLRKVHLEHITKLHLGSLLYQVEHYQSWITLRLVLAAPWVVLWSKQRWLTVTALEKCISNPCPEYFQLEKILFRDQAWPVRFGWLPAKHTNCGDPRLLYQIAAKIATLCSPIGFLLSAPCNFFTAEGLSVPCVKIAVILPQDVRAFQ